MASRGSVIPLFVSQIKSGKALTITDPEMTRFMMSLPQAVELVLFAFEHGMPGDTFVQKAPAATILTLAEAVQKVFGVRQEIRILGTRHGEKKHETLLSREELVRSEDLVDYFRVPSDSRDLNYAQYFETGNEGISREEDYTSQNTRRLDEQAMIDLLMDLECIQQELGNKESSI